MNLYAGHSPSYPTASEIYESIMSLHRSLLEDQDQARLVAQCTVQNETPNFHWTGHNGLAASAYVGDFNVVVDDNLERQKMVPSEAFKRIQSPELVESTNQWMREFFGVEYQILRMGNVLVMHSKALEKLREVIGGRSAPNYGEFTNVG